MTEVRLGDKRIPFIYQGNELIHPNPVKDGLMLWYDFSAMSNSDVSKGIAKDLSGNGHDGTLQNFNYTNESGYVGNGLKFDGADDYVNIGSSYELFGESPEGMSGQFIFKTPEDLSEDFYIIGGNYGRPFTFHWRASLNQFSLRFRGEDMINDYIFMDSLKIDTLYELAFSLMIGESNEVFVSIRGGGVEDTSTHAIEGSQNYGDYTLYLGQEENYKSVVPVTLYSTKLYNRPLTAEEIQHNYQLERERFL